FHLFAISLAHRWFWGREKSVSGSFSNGALIGRAFGVSYLFCVRLGFAKTLWISLQPLIKNWACSSHCEVPGFSPKLCRRKFSGPVFSSNLRIKEAIAL